jgi:hypothetical protein
MQLSDVLYRPVFYHRVSVDECGSILAAILFQEFIELAEDFDAKQHGKRVFHRWFQYDSDDMVRRLGMTRSEQEHALNQLRDRELIITELREQGTQTFVHIIGLGE